MLRLLDSLRGLKLEATDGEIGRVEDFLFDDLTWTIRYLVVDTGPWLFGREVLISPVAVMEMATDSKGIPVGLSKEHVKNSPDVDLAEPVSRQLEDAVHAHYGWQNYWMTLPLGPQDGAAATPPPLVAPESVDETNVQRAANPNLRSAEEILGYDVDAEGETVGHIDDFLVDDEDWTLRYMVVSTSSWLAGERVLVAPAWLKYFDWDEEVARMNLSRQAIEESPRFEQLEAISREFETRLHEHYGREVYWR